MTEPAAAGAPAAGGTGNATAATAGSAAVANQAGGAGRTGSGGASSSPPGTAAGTGGATAPGTGKVSYSTTFDLSESPISESGAWVSANVESTRVWTAGGFAFGTQAGTGAYNDSYAHLTGFPPDQLASGVVHIASNVTRNTTHEVEILLRVSDGPHSLSGYECNFAFDGSYVQIVRWDTGSFTYLAGPAGGQGNISGGLHEGDTVSAMIVGNVITSYVNGVQAATATDSTYKTGNPGMAFWRGGPSNSQDDFAFTRYSASSL